MARQKSIPGTFKGDLISVAEVRDKDIALIRLLSNNEVWVFASKKSKGHHNTCQPGTYVEIDAYCSTYDKDLNFWAYAVRETSRPERREASN